MSPKFQIYLTIAAKLIGIGSLSQIELIFLRRFMPMNLQTRLKALSQLGQWFKEIQEDELSALSSAAANENNWFTLQNIQKAFDAWGEALSPEDLNQWVSQYSFNVSNKKVGLVCAGNIPLVGLHDVISVLVSGHQVMIKYSSQDSILMRRVISELCEIESGFKEMIIEVERLNEADAVIATGSDNSARYFKHYFSQKPHIIRQNRVSVGILQGDESEDQLERLGKDIFTYFGLGCRNVSKLYIPEGFDLPRLIKSLEAYENTLEHHKYRNNYDYNKSIYLVNKEPHLDSGFFLMRESEDLVSPISVIYYETYKHEAELSLKISAQKDKIQCMVSAEGWYEGSLNFGTAQSPALWDYADGVDTLEFLSQL